MIYLDNNATTAMVRGVLEAMMPFWTGQPGNPGSTHRLGSAARTAVDEARVTVATVLDAHPEEVIFTSGGTESNNAAIIGALLAVRAAQPRRCSVLLSAIEHASVIELAPILRGRFGAEVGLLPVTPTGVVDVSAAAQCIGDRTAVVSLMWANNETGAIQPIGDIGRLARSAGALLHVDAVQAVGRVPVRFSEEPMDLLSLSAHKFHGPKGVGALLVRRGRPWQPWLFGGPQEAQRRGGTENVPGIVGLAAALRLADDWLRQSHTPGCVSPTGLAELRDRLERTIAQRLSGVAVTAAEGPRLPNTAHLRFDGCRGDAILMALDERGICVSVGSACSSGSSRPSHVLTAMGLSETAARSAVRFSLSRLTTTAEIDATVEQLVPLVSRLRHFSDDWSLTGQDSRSSTHNWTH